MLLPPRGYFLPPLNITTLLKLASSKEKEGDRWVHLANWKTIWQKQFWKAVSDWQSHFGMYMHHLDIPVCTPVSPCAS